MVEASDGLIENPPGLTPTFACVSERGDGWFRTVFDLALSIRRFGGALADAPVVVHFVEGVDPGHAEALEGLGATVRIVDRFDPDYPFANKLRMLESPPEPGTNAIVALDCDVVVLGDMTRFLVPGAIGAKPADCDYLSESQWGRIFKEVSVDAPLREWSTTTFKRRTYPYFNSGVLVVPQDLADPLAEHWARFIYELADVRRRIPDLVPLFTYTDQVALTLGLVEGRLPVRGLPVAMNFPAHLDINKAYLDGAFPPLAVHHHGLRDSDGFLLPTRYGRANEMIDRFNRERASTLAVSYRGLSRRTALARLKQFGRSRPWYYSRLSGGMRSATTRVLPSTRG